MPAEQRTFPVDWARLAETMAVLAYEARLEMLDRLRFPKPASELRIPPQRLREGENPERPMSKQAVQAHLSKLVETGFVHLDVREPGPGQRIHYYTSNAPQLYALAEELRSLCVRYSATVPVGNATGTLAAGRPLQRARGPSLVLVHGVYEGKVFELSAENAAEEGWLVGRRPPAQVVLDYDPFVSGKHALVTRDSQGFHVADLRNSKNGTSVNWQLLRKGATERLHPGDIIGVGRSLLVFAPGAQ